MKHIDIPEPYEVPVLDTEGQPWLDEHQQPLRMNFARLARAFTLHDAFVEGLDAIEATELRLKVKKKLDALDAKTKRLLLEDDECRRLQKAMKASRPQPFIAMACIHHMHAIRDAHDPPKPEEPKPEEDAATAN